MNSWLRLKRFDRREGSPLLILLEQIADSGDIKVCEGYSCLNQNDYLSASPNVEFCVVLDGEEA